MQKTSEWEEENIFRAMLESFYDVLEHNKKASMDILINAIKQEKEKSRQELIDELVGEINNMAIEHAGNAAKTVDQIINILKSKK